MLAHSQVIVIRTLSITSSQHCDGWRFGTKHTNAWKILFSPPLHHHQTSLCGSRTHSLTYSPVYYCTVYYMTGSSRRRREITRTCKISSSCTQDLALREGERERERLILRERESERQTHRDRHTHTLSTSDHFLYCPMCARPNRYTCRVLYNG